MKCQKCGINEATTHIKQTINGHKSEVWLCHKCASEESVFSAFKPATDYDFEDFFSNLWGASTPTLKQTSSESVCKTFRLPVNADARHIIVKLPLDVHFFSDETMHS